MIFLKKTIPATTICFLFALTLCADPSTSEARQKEKFKKRNLIVVNDGMDVSTFAKTVEGLDSRLKGYLPTQMSSMDFCVSFAGFGKFLYRTSVGDIQVDKEHLPNNLTPELLEKGTDPLKFVIDIFHPAKREVFCSFRMNDIHDYSPDAAYGSSTFKTTHPEYLFGKLGDIVPHGRWSGIDYGQKEVRDKFCEYFQEVCQNYDIDAITLNFWRHMPLFKSVAWGKPVSAEEKTGLTDMMRKLRKIADTEGAKRKRPILIGLHIPDSAQYCEEHGIELEKWLSEDLADMLYMTEYFRLNKWEKSVELGKKYNTPVFACLTDARVSSEPSIPYSKKLEKVRNSFEAYRGLAALAWDAGVNGLYVFNKANPGFLPFKEIGDPEMIKFKDKAYFCSWDGGARPCDEPGKSLKGGAKYASLPSLSPNRPVSLKETAPLDLTVDMAEDISGAVKKGIAPEIFLLIRADKGTAPELLKVEFNSSPLASGKSIIEGDQILPFQSAWNFKDDKISTLYGDWIEYKLPLQSVAKGENKVKISLADKSAPLKIYDLMVRSVYPKK
jgi:hypothetical protein